MKKLLTFALLMAFTIPFAGCQKRTTDGASDAGANKPAETSTEHKTMKPVTPESTPKPAAGEDGAGGTTGAKKPG